MSTNEAKEQQVPESMMDAIKFGTEEDEDRQVTEAMLSLNIIVPVITAKLSNKNDSDEINRCFKIFQFVANKYLMLRRRNRSLLNQSTNSGPNDSKTIEEIEHEDKFEKYQIDRENLLKDVNTQTIIYNLRKEIAKLTNKIEALESDNSAMTSKIEALESDNSAMTSKIEALKSDNSVMTSEIETMTTKIEALESDNSAMTSEIEALKSDNSAMTSKIEALESDNSAMTSKIEALESDNSAMTSKIEALESGNSAITSKIEALETTRQNTIFQNYLADVFRYIRDGIICKASSTAFPKGSDSLSLLCSTTELEDPDEDDFDENEMHQAIAEVNQKKMDYEKAFTFISDLGLDASLVRDLRVFNKVRNEDTHDADCKLIIKCKLTSKKNQTALKELRTILEGLHIEHAAFHLKTRLISWLESAIVNN